MHTKALIPRIVFITAGVLLIVGSLLPWLTITYPPSDNSLLISSQHNGVSNGYTPTGGILLILFGIFRNEKRRKLFALLGVMVASVCGWVLLYISFGAAFSTHYARLQGAETTFGIGFTLISPLGVFLGLIGSLLSGSLKEPGDTAFEADRPAAPANLFKRWKIPVHPKKFVITGGLFLAVSVVLSWIAGLLDASLSYQSGRGFSVIGSYHYTFQSAQSILILACGLHLIFIGAWQQGKPGEPFSLLGVLAAGLCAALFFHVLRQYFFYLLPFLVGTIRNHDLLTPTLISLYSFLGAIGAGLGLIGSAAEAPTETTFTSADPVPS